MHQHIPIKTNYSPTIFYCPTNRIDLSELDPQLQQLYSQYMNANFTLAENETILDGQAVYQRKKLLVELYGNMTYAEFNLQYSSMNEATLRKTHCYLGYEVSGDVGNNCNSEIQLVLTERGVCYQVNAEKRIPLEEGMLGAVNILTLVDLNKSLRAELLNGVEVFVKDQGSFPNRFDRAEVLAPGQIHTLKVTLQEVTVLPARDGNPICFPTEEPGDYYPVQFYGPPNNCQNACYASRTLLYLNDTLGCVDVPNNYTQGTRLCTMNDLEDLIDSTTDLPLGTTTRRFIDQQIFEKVPSGCLPACTQKLYQTAIHSSPIYASALKLAARFFNVTEEEARPSLIGVRVVFPSTMSVVKEIRTYTINNYLGDVGGVLGLFLGFSFFTIIEYIYFVVFYLIKRFSTTLKGDWLRDLEERETSYGLVEDHGGSVENGHDKTVGKTRPISYISMC
ncbi:hypothetical protein ACHWQZ_G013795 [Mnemiopsis leidyi]